MRVLLLSFLFVMISVYQVCAQINIQLLHQLIAESKSENKVQNTAKNRQSEVTANEEVNRTKMGKLKDRYRQLKNRFHTLGLAIDAVQIGIKAAPIVDEIVEQQRIVLDSAQDNPLLIPLALQAEEDLMNRSRLLLNYLYGLMVSFGDINQMKASDRKMLFNHVIDELRIIAGTSKGLAICVMNSNRRLPSNPFEKWINEDKRLVDDIKRKISILKK